MTYGTPGIGTSPHMCMELLKNMAGIDLRHIPYRGTVPALTDVMSGQISGMFATALSARPQIDAGNVRALGLSSKKRSAAMPNVLPIAEVGVPGYEATQWYGFLAPAGTPPDIIARIHAEAAKALKSKDLHRQARRRWRRTGRQHACGIRRLHQGRAGEVDAGREVRRYRAAVARRPSCQGGAPPPLIPAQAGIQDRTRNW